MSVNRGAHGRSKSDLNTLRGGALNAGSAEQFPQAPIGKYDHYSIVQMQRRKRR